MKKLLLKIYRKVEAFLNEIAPVGFEGAHGFHVGEEPIPAPVTITTNNAEIERLSFKGKSIFLLIISRNGVDAEVEVCRMSMENIVEVLETYNYSPNPHLQGKTRPNQLEEYTFTLWEIIA